LVRQRRFDLNSKAPLRFSKVSRPLIGACISHVSPNAEQSYLVLMMACERLVELQTSSSRSCQPADGLADELQAQFVNEPRAQDASRSVFSSRICDRHSQDPNHTYLKRVRTMQMIQCAQGNSKVVEAAGSSFQVGLFGSKAATL